MPVVPDPSVPTICDLPYPDVADAVLLAMTPAARDDVFARQDLWIGECG